MLNTINTEEIKLVSRDILDCPQYLKKRVIQLLDQYEEDNSRTAGLNKIITVKVGAKVMLRRNIDVTLGLVNGAIGELIGFSREINSEDFDTIQFRLPTGAVHSLERASSKFELMDKAYVVRHQFPISLSYGITVHKSQGLSLKTVLIDAGNTVFSCGQIYVALSRVTSLEGLHLINFDPYNVQANKLAILEYNRLRKNYRPDLAVISYNGERSKRIIDLHWAELPNHNYSEITRTNDAAVSTMYSVKGFINNDKTSAYANAVMQCMLNCQHIRKILIDKKRNRDELKTLAEAYINNDISLLNSFGIRQSLGGKFVENIPQDASEFLLYVINNDENIKACLEHELTHKIHCKVCNRTIVNTEKNLILTLPLCVMEGKSKDLNEIIKMTYSKWQLLNDSCIYCQSDQVFVKTDITMARDIMVIQLIPFQREQKNIIRIKKFSIKGAHNTKINIAQKKYKTISAIFHHEIDNSSGHYTCFVLQKRNKFVSIDDEIIQQKPWPRGAKDAYLLFFEKD